MPTPPQKTSPSQGFGPSFAGSRTHQLVGCAKLELGEDVLDERQRAVLVELGPPIGTASGAVIPGVLQPEPLYPVV